MEHLAILTGDWYERILDGSKTCETRFYKVCIPPMEGNKTYAQGIVAGERVYLKKSGKPVSAYATVRDAMFFRNYADEDLARILSTYESQMGFGMDSFENLKDKRHCVLVFLEDVVKLDTPFDIDKTGFGVGAAWLTFESIDALRV